MAKRPISRTQQSQAADAATETAPRRRTRKPSAQNDDPRSQAQSQVDVRPSEDEIRERAYHRYLQRGGGHGMDFEDWLEAERELRTQK